MAGVNGGGGFAADPAPLVSVIIIFLDGLPYLDEAVASIKAQTCSDWELILVDDGSTDGSSESAQRHAADEPHRIRVVAHPAHANLGMSASRNLGLRTARGRYVAFLDADDVYLPERLQRHVEILERLPDVGLVQSDLVFWYSWMPAAKRPSHDEVRPFLAPGDRLLAPPEALLTVLAAPFLSAGICNITVRRDVAIDVGGFESDFRGLYEDQVFTSKLYLRCRCYVLQAYLARYRRHPGSWVRRARASGQLVEGARNASTDAFQSWLREYVAASGIRHPLLDAMLARAAGPRRTAGPVRRVALRVVRRLRWGVSQDLPKLLPARWLRRLAHREWERQVRRARQQHAQLCAELTRLAQPGSDGTSRLR
jgi:glycosyltransferase involved in cell wall biosynthesis